MYLLFVVFSAMCYSIQKILIYNFSNSIFRDKDPTFWNPTVAFVKARKILGFRLEAVHIFQLLTLGFLQIAIVASQSPTLGTDFLPWWVQLLGSVILFKVTEKIFTKHLTEK